MVGSKKGAKEAAAEPSLYAGRQPGVGQSAADSTILKPAPIRNDVDKTKINTKNATGAG
jgi:hypothetical protein